MSIDTTTELTKPSTEYTGTAVAAQPYPETARAETESPRGLPAPVWIVAACVAVLLAAAIVYGLMSRAAAERHLIQTTNADALLTVSVVHPTITGTASEIALPGNTQAYKDTPIYARTSGYLKQWFVDIGGHVQQGQLMAIIETPEVDQQLQVAQA